jgi:hypothetical protein
MWRGRVWVTLDQRYVRVIALWRQVIFDHRDFIGVYGNPLLLHATQNVIAGTQQI